MKSWDEGVESFSSSCGFVYECGLCAFIFSVVFKELPEKRGGFILLLFRNKSNYMNMFYGGDWYSTMNDTLMIYVFPFISSVGRNLQCSSIMKALLRFIIRCRLVMWYQWWYTIIIGGTGWFTRTPTPFCIILIWAVWFKLNKYSQKWSI